MVEAKREKLSELLKGFSFEQQRYLTLRMMGDRVPDVLRNVKRTWSTLGRWRENNRLPAKFREVFG